MESANCGVGRRKTVGELLKDIASSRKKERTSWTRSGKLMRVRCSLASCGIRKGGTVPARNVRPLEGLLAVGRMVRRRALGAKEGLATIGVAGVHIVIGLETLALW